MHIYEKKCQAKCQFAMTFKRKAYYKRARKQEMDSHNASYRENMKAPINKFTKLANILKNDGK